jgi:hypothetical protein
MLLPGQPHDTVGKAPLIDEIEIDALIGDKGFDNDWLARNWTIAMPLP